MECMPDIVPIKKRRYEEIPVDKIKVINSRSRDQEQFDMNVQSIDAVGLLKPIRVNDKFLERTEMYELICGEGRLLARQQLGRQVVVAEVVTCTRKEAYLQSLVENLARTKRGTMKFARELETAARRGLGLPVGCQCFVVMPQPRAEGDQPAAHQNDDRAFQRVERAEHHGDDAQGKKNLRAATGLIC